MGADDTTTALSGPQCRELRILLAALRFTHDRADLRAGHGVEVYAHPWPAEGEQFDAQLSVSLRQENARPLKGLSIQLFHSGGDPVPVATTDKAGLAHFAGLEPGTYSAWLRAQDGPDSLGLTPRIRHDFELFLQKMQDVAPLMLERMDISMEHVPAFLVYLGTDEIRERLREAEHVRDALGGTMPEFCRTENLQPSPAPERFLDRRVIDNILYQVAVAVVGRRSQDAEDRQRLDRVGQALQERLIGSTETEPPARTVRFALTDYTDQVSRDLWQRIESENEMLT